MQGGTPMTEFNSMANSALSTSFILIFGFLSLFLLYLLGKLLPIIKKVHIPIYRNLKSDWVHDVTKEEFPIPEQHQNTDPQLKELGMQPLAVLHVKPAFLDAAYEWVYVSQSGTIYVEVVYTLSASVLLQFMSCFPDDAILITRYPQGETVITPNYVSRFARNSIDAALNFHKQQLKEWKEQHGEPLIVKTIDDALQYDEIFRIKYRKLDTMRIIKLNNRLLFLTISAFIIFSFSFFFILSGGKGIVILATSTVGLILLSKMIEAAKYTQENILYPSGAVEDNAERQF
jgi:hypothetical protein